MFLHMVIVIKLSTGLTGSLYMSPSFGGFMAKANVPEVPMIRFTHSSFTAVTHDLGIWVPEYQNEDWALV